jgi:tRNA 2-thiouridine synthesizing protein E
MTRGDEFMTTDHFRFRRRRAKMRTLGRRRVHGARVMIAEAATARPAQANPLPIAFDDAGFLADPHSWTPALAEQLALLEGMDGLSAEHRQIIDLVRERWFRLGALPVMRLVCRSVQIEPHAAHRLFRSCRSLWFVAGLPDPGEEARAYMS